MTDNELRSVQCISREALQEIDAIFRKHVIPYFLLYGTVLGAVRHKGFIPWDDDIDIGIFYEDKERAYAVLRKGLSGRFKWIDNCVDPNFPRLFGKVLYNGVGCVDVFVLVKTTSNAWKRSLQWIERKILFKLYKGKLTYSNANENRNIYEISKVYFARLFAKLFTMKCILRFIECNEKRYEGLEAPVYYLSLYGAYHLKNETLRAEWFNQLSSVSFEGDDYPTTCCPDAYLTQLYGNYMCPPADKRPRHGSEKF